MEGRIEGSSLFLQPLDLSLSINPREEGIAICVSDRRDWCHQFAVRRERARSSRLAPSFPSSMFQAMPTNAELGRLGFLRGGPGFRTSPG